MEEPLSVQPQIQPGESLGSLLCRTVLYNQFSLLDFLNYVKSETKRNMQTSDYGLVNTLPTSWLNLHRLSELLEVSSDALLKSSFYPIYSRFAINGHINRARLTSDFLGTECRFCPDCLVEGAYHRLLWLVKPITHCPQHGTLLRERCDVCGQRVGYDDVILDECTCCSATLSESKHSGSDGAGNLEEQLWLTKTLETLLSDVDPTPLSGQEVALRLLYLIGQRASRFDREQVEMNLENGFVLPTLLQHARQSLSQERTLHLSFILRKLRVSGATIYEFLNLKVPREFIDSVCLRRTSLLKQMSCIAPWCQSFGKPGSLIKTGTTVRYLAEGEKQRYYMACLSCGCEYALNEEGILVERTPFIDAYQRLVQDTNHERSLRALAQTLDYSIDEVKRVVAYFQTRIPFIVPVMEVDQNLVERFVLALKNGMTLKSIATWSDWENYRTFLVYRYHARVMRTEHQLRRARKGKRSDLSTHRREVERVLRKLSASDCDITISTVCRELGVCPETIRNWQCNDLISKAKSVQIGERKSQFREAIINRAEQYLQLKTHTTVRSSELYEFVGTRRTVIWREFPEVTAYLTLLLSDHNRNSSV